jgi:cell division protein FtsL
MSKSPEHENHLAELLGNRRSIRLTAMGGALAVAVAMVAMLILGVKQATTLAELDRQIASRHQTLSELQKKSDALYVEIDERNKTISSMAQVSTALANAVGDEKTKEIYDVVAGGHPRPVAAPGIANVVPNESDQIAPLPRKGHPGAGSMEPTSSSRSPVESPVNPDIAGKLVYIQIGKPEDKRRAEDLRRALSAAGAIAPGIEVVPSLPNRGEVRYFSNLDQVAAEATAKLTSTELRLPFIARFVQGHSSVRSHVEIYFPKAP